MSTRPVKAWEYSLKKWDDLTEAELAALELQTIGQVEKDPDGNEFLIYETLVSVGAITPGESFVGDVAIVCYGDPESQEVRDALEGLSNYPGFSRTGLIHYALWPFLQDSFEYRVKLRGMQLNDLDEPIPKDLAKDVWMEIIRPSILRGIRDKNIEKGIPLLPPDTPIMELYTALRAPVRKLVETDIDPEGATVKKAIYEDFVKVLSLDYAWVDDSEVDEEDLTQREKKIEQLQYFISMDRVGDMIDMDDLGSALDVIEQLPNDDQDFIGLYVVGYSLKEISNILGIKEATARKRWERIRKRVKDIREPQDKL